MADPTWDTVALPILEAIAKLEGSIHGPDHQQVADQTGLDVEIIAKELPALISARYITAGEAHDLANVYFHDLRLIERGKVAVGQWPGNNAYDVLIDRLDQMIAAASPADRPKLAAFKDAAISLGARVGGSVLGDVIRDVMA